MNGRFTILPYKDDGPNCKHQKWRLDAAGALMHKASKKPLSITLTGIKYEAKLGSRGSKGTFNVFRLSA